jgi:hypothetical protein
LSRLSPRLLNTCRQHFNRVSTSPASFAHAWWGQREGAFLQKDISFHSLAHSLPPLRACCAPCSPPCCCARICAHLVPAAAQHVKEAQGEHIPSLLCTRAVGSKRGCIPVQRHLFTYHWELTHSLPSPLRSCSPPCCCARICAHHDTHPSHSRHTLAWRHNPRGARR